MRDVFDYAAPFGFMGAVASRLFLTRSMRQFLASRNRVLVLLAESPDGDRYVGEASAASIAAAVRPH